MTRAADIHRTLLSRTTLFVRWLVLLVIAFDVLSAPLHAHAHDMGSDLLMPDLHAVGQGPGPESDDLDSLRRATPVQRHHHLGHSMAALRTGKREPVATPDLSLIVASVAALSSLPRPLTPVTVAWSVAPPERLPALCRCLLRPEGRAPPVLHS